MKNKKTIISGVLLTIIILIFTFIYLDNHKKVRKNDNDIKDVSKETYQINKEINVPQNIEEEKKIFTKYFKKIKEIQLDDKILLAVISNLDINEEGNLLVTDNVGKKVYLFDANGKVKKILSADTCHPGFNLNPIYAKFTKENEILLVNSGPWGFRFKKNGDCLGDVDQSFVAPLHVCFKNNGNMIGYYNYNENGGAYLEEMDPLGKPIKKFGEFPQDLSNIVSRLEGGGIVCDNNNNIYQLDVTSPTVKKYDSKGKYVGKISRKPSYFRGINEDIKEYSGNPMELMKSVKNLFKKNTISYSLNMLDKDKILVQLLNNKKYGIEIFDLNGNFLFEDELIYDKPIAATSNGYLYIVSQPTVSKNGILPNPIIEIYKLII